MSDLYSPKRCFCGGCALYGTDFPIVCKKHATKEDIPLLKKCTNCTEQAIFGPARGDNVYRCKKHKHNNELQKINEGDITRYYRICECDKCGNYCYKHYNNGIINRRCNYCLKRYGTIKAHRCNCGRIAEFGTNSDLTTIDKCEKHKNNSDIIKFSASMGVYVPLTKCIHCNNLVSSGHIKCKRCYGK